MGYVLGHKETEQLFLSKLKPDGGVAFDEVLPLFFFELKPNFKPSNAAHDQCVAWCSPAVAVCCLTVYPWCCFCLPWIRLKLAAYCCSSFRLYWAARKHHEENVAFEDEAFDWRTDPYLSSSIPAVQVNGMLVSVYYARLTPNASSFETSSKWSTCEGACDSTCAFDACVTTLLQSAAWSSSPSFL